MNSQPEVRIADVNVPEDGRSAPARLFTVPGTLALVLSLVLTGSARAGDSAAADRAAMDFFETAVRPVLVQSCQKCHGPDKSSSGLRLDSREAILKGGASGPAIVPGQPGASLLVQAVAHSHEELKMPPRGKLPDAQVAALRRWVELGAPWAARPAGAHAVATAGTPDPATRHWAFTPVRPLSPPEVKNSAWVRTPVDAFVLARLEREGLEPSPPSDRRTLLRRATLDLLGIPPTAAEIDTFVNDPHPDAFARVVDRLLASPLYGERWGRHWLDVARYADTKGYVFQEERKYPFSYTYRDYVIRSFNADLPYDRFLIQQLAADQLDLHGDPRPLAAMGFLTVGRRFLNDRNEIIDDRIDVVGRGLMGLTIGCARCHDHKYDPIPAEDYYALYGVFASCLEPDDLPRLDRPGETPDPQAEAHKGELDKARKERDQYLSDRRAQLFKFLQARYSTYLKAAYDLQLDPRSSRLDERARAEQIDPQRLRAAILLWKRGLGMIQPDHPFVGPLKALGDVPSGQFASRAADLLTRQPSPLHPLLARALREPLPKSLDELVDRYVGVLSNQEKRAGKEPSPLASAGESLRQALFAPGGVLATAAENPRLVLSAVQRKQYTKLENTVKQIEAKSAGKAGRAMVLVDAPQPTEPQVFVRGNPGRPGKAVPRQFLRLLAGPNRQPFRKGSGRMELAQAVADPANPLTARVLVNRVWHWHFGQGLVTTPSDFGLRSDPPSHPELLDHLARLFIDEGWSIKALHRRIMLSSTYQQASDPRPECLARDPQNRWVWRYNRQRLDLETLRDSVLAVAGASIRPWAGRRSCSWSRPSPRGARFTASSTARTWTASTAPLISPCPTPPAPGGSSPPCPSRRSS